MKNLTTRKWWEFVGPLYSREEFDTGGSLRGRTILTTTGQLPNEFVTTIRVLEAEGHLSYVVYSYNTPIAWRDVYGDWTVPDTFYSHTTSNHQHKIETAIDAIRDGKALEYIGR